jgi:alkylated DNA repair protein (DNA oxidative demethylase)
MNKTLPKGLYYHFPFISRAERAEILNYLSTLHPLWEMRFSEHNPPPEGDQQRELLRPVYWLGNWQFACLDYFHPPQGIEWRCVRAETYPPVLQKVVDRIQTVTRSIYSASDVPKDWKLNTCLINFYGDKIIDGKKTDTARVGEHKDFEPGPVASLSLGDRAFFQFVSGNKKIGQEIFWQGWLEDSSLQIFGTKKWKEQCFHRVQRVDRKRKDDFKLNTQNFETRRINFTFRYVPDEYIRPYSEFPEHLKSDIRIYMETLAEHSEHFRSELSKKNSDKNQTHL